MARIGTPLSNTACGARGEPSSVTDAGLAVEDRVVREVFLSENAREGVAAFLEKRPAVFR